MSVSLFRGLTSLTCFRRPAPIGTGARNGIPGPKPLVSRIQRVLPQQGAMHDASEGARAAIGGPRAMTLRAADLRFVLPHSVSTATVIDGAPSAVADGLHAAGVLAPGRDEPVDLVVATADATERALNVPARSYLVLGRVDPRAVRRSGRVASQVLVLGDPNRPAAL